MPSAHAGTLLQAAGRGIAERLGVPFREHVLGPKASVPPQRTMANSVQQLRNVHAGLDVTGQPLPGPVLLLDDRVDSRWTLTWAGHRLQQAGSGPVQPLVLLQALSGTDD